MHGEVRLLALAETLDISWFSLYSLFYSEENWAPKLRRFNLYMQFDLVEKYFLSTKDVLDICKVFGFPAFKELVVHHSLSKIS